jgi:hypothetical protein
LAFPAVETSRNSLFFACSRVQRLNVHVARCVSGQLRARACSFRVFHTRHRGWSRLWWGTNRRTDTWWPRQSLRTSSRFFRSLQTRSHSNIHPSRGWNRPVAQTHPRSPRNPEGRRMSMKPPCIRTWHGLNRCNTRSWRCVRCGETAADRDSIPDQRVPHTALFFLFPSHLQHCGVASPVDLSFLPPFLTKLSPHVSSPSRVYPSPRNPLSLNTVVKSATPNEAFKKEGEGGESRRRARRARIAHENSRN